MTPAIGRVMGKDDPQEGRPRGATVQVAASEHLLRKRRTKLRASSRLNGTIKRRQRQDDGEVRVEQSDGSHDREQRHREGDGRQGQGREHQIEHELAPRQLVAGRAKAYAASIVTT